MMRRASLLLGFVFAPAVAVAGPLLGAEAPSVLMSLEAEPAPARESGAGAFFVEESRLRASLDAAAPDDRTAAADALAEFYERKGLHVEALAAIVEPERESARLRFIRCSYALGRYDAALSAASEESLARHPQATALRAMALARLGAFAKARAAFSGLGPSAAPVALRQEFLLAAAEAELHGGDLRAAQARLRDAGGSAEAEFIRLQIRAATGDSGAAEAGLKALAGRGGQIGARARLALAASRPSSLAAARLSWSGGAFEREALSIELAGATAPEAIFDAGRALTERHPSSDAAERARAFMAAALSTLFQDDRLSAHDAARLFFENIDFTPPGAEGDRLIRDVADRLVALDLLDPAAELLEHQTFQRLRGAERARVATRLAALHLERKRPLEALRVIRSTRIAGLDAAFVRERLLLEARALEETGAAEAAITLLADASGRDVSALRADINWRRADWAEAARAYAAAFAGEGEDAASRSFALRAAVAYLSAGDDEGLETFVAAAAPALAGTREGDMLAELAAEDGTARFMDAYRKAFAADPRSSI